MPAETRSILVTGASRGIGRAIARRLAQDGFEVVVHYHRDDDAAAQSLAEIEAAGGRGRPLRFDIADRALCREALEQDIAARGCYYGVVLNAGIARDAAFPMLEAEDWDAVMRTNLDGFYNVLQPLIMPMLAARRGGRIVALSSLSGQIGNRGQVNYSAAKAGIIGAVKALAVELAKRQITVNCVAPGLIDTEMLAGLPLEEVVEQIPMRRIGRPEEAAAVVAFLCSDAASYVTRQVIAVNGGLA